MFLESEVGSDAPGSGAGKKRPRSSWRARELARQCAGNARLTRTLSAVGTALTRCLKSKSHPVWARQSNDVGPDEHCPSMKAAFVRRPLTAQTIHLCVDMQRLFSADGPWPTPWMDRVLPVVTEIARRHPERTVFTRFIPPVTPDEVPGTWQLYYEQWRDVTRERLDPRLLHLLPPLATLVPPATVIDKSRYSAFSGSHLYAHLKERCADGLVVTGSETDVCVLATILDAVDLGFHVVVVRDAVCSSSDAGHDALLDLYHRRYSVQIEIAGAAELIERWR
jgi:nicotinamidase-related amidase